MSLDENKNNETNNENGNAQPENTEEIKAEQQADTPEESVTEGQGSAPEETTAAEPQSKVYFENMQAPAPAAVPVQGKTKLKINTPIIIGGIILILALVTFLAYTIFFDTSIVGTWSYSVDTAGTATPDEATADEADEVKIFLIFEADGAAKMCIGTQEARGDYTVSLSDNNESIVSLNITQTVFTGDFGYKVTGNKITGRTLTLYYEGEEIMKFNSDSFKTPKLDVPEDFKTNDKMIGTWQDEMYGIKYTFNKDGTLIMNQSDTIIISGVYTLDEENGAIKFTIVGDGQEELLLSYGYDEESDTLVIDTLGYKRVTEGSGQTDTTAAADAQ